MYIVQKFIAKMCNKFAYVFCAMYNKRDDRTMTDDDIIREVVMTRTAAVAISGVIGGVLINLTGGWDNALRALVIFMFIDYLSGLIVAGVFKNSPNSSCGTLESKAGIRGLFRKGMMLGLVLVAVQLDQLIGSSIVRSGVIIALCFNEAISVTESAGLMGIKIPNSLSSALDLLKKKGENDD